MPGYLRPRSSPTTNPMVGIAIANTSGKVVKKARGKQKHAKPSNDPQNAPMGRSCFRNHSFEEAIEVPTFGVSSRMVRITTALTGPRRAKLLFQSRPIPGSASNALCTPGRGRDFMGCKSPVRNWESRGSSVYQMTAPIDKVRGEGNFGRGTDRGEETGASAARLRTETSF